MRIKSQRMLFDCIYCYNLAFCYYCHINVVYEGLSNHILNSLSILVRRLNLIKNYLWIFLKPISYCSFAEYCMILFRIIKTDDIKYLFFLIAWEIYVHLLWYSIIDLPNAWIADWFKGFQHRQKLINSTQIRNWKFSSSKQVTSSQSLIKIFK